MTREQLDWFIRDVETWRVPRSRGAIISDKRREIIGALYAPEKALTSPMVAAVIVV